LCLFSNLEFDVWFNECYLNGNNNPGGMDNILSSNQTNNDYQMYDDAAERFERMQKELLLSDLDSMPFRQAQMRTNRRVNKKKGKYFSIWFYSFFQHVFDAASAQGSWKHAPTTTTSTANSGSSYGRNYDQEQQTFSSLPMNGSRQKPMVR